MKAYEDSRFDAASRSRLQLAVSSCEHSVFAGDLPLLQSLLVRPLARAVFSLRGVRPRTPTAAILRLAPSGELSVAWFLRGHLLGSRVSRHSSLAGLRSSAFRAACSIVRAFHPMILDSISAQSTSPNHALQRTAPAVTARASTAAFPPAMHGPRQPPPSLSLGSLGVSSRLL